LKSGKISNILTLGFGEVADEAPDSIDDLIDYFRDHWMKNVKLSLWNVAELNVLTHNNVKGWNNRFNKRMNRHHRNM
jgi:hypothetical protein